MAWLRRLVSISDSSKSYFHGVFRSYTSLPRPVYQEKNILVAMSTPLLPAKDTSAEDSKVAQLDPSVFGHSMRRDILYLCVTHYMDNIRQGTASTKTRGEVAGSGRKIRPQKGSGRARLGDAQSPMLRGGGVAFGPKPRDFSTKLPRKVQQMGMRVALSTRLRESCLAIVENLHWDGVKTGAFNRRLNELGWTKSLLVTGMNEIQPELERSSRNIPTVKVVQAKDLNVYEVLKWPMLILDIDAVEFFERFLGRNVPEHLRIPFPRQKSLRFSRMIAGRTPKKSPKIPHIDAPQESNGIMESQS